MALDNDVLAGLPALLAEAPSGLAFIYRALEEVARHHRLRDAVLVLDSPIVGIQAFRLGRRPLGAPSSAAQAAWVRQAAKGPPRLLADPPVVDDETSRLLVHLGGIALRLDLLDHDASHDALTGLLNRRSYEMLFESAIAQGRRYGWPFTLVLLDLDGFKQINDNLGHAAGDAVLHALGTELRASLRAGDLAARVGGDEFALLLRGAGSQEVMAPLRSRLHAALDRAVPGSSVRFSAGVASFPDDGDDRGTLTRVADERLYEGKLVAGA